jgi:hypothetical protein
MVGCGDKGLTGWPPASLMTMYALIKVSNDAMADEDDSTRR